MKFSDLDNKYGIFELASYFLETAKTTTLLVGGVTSMALFGVLPLL